MHRSWSGLKRPLKCLVLGHDPYGLGHVTFGPVNIHSVLLLLYPLVKVLRKVLHTEVLKGESITFLQIYFKWQHNACEWISCAAFFSGLNNVHKKHLIVHLILWCAVDCDWIDELTESVISCIKHVASFHPIDELHISLSKTFVLRHHWIEPLIADLQRTVALCRAWVNGLFICCCCFNLASDFRVTQELPALLVGRKVFNA